jgi:hypothetical protein
LFQQRLLVLVEQRLIMTRADPAFQGLYRRLVACTDDPENGQSCWIWKRRITKRYPVFNLRARGKHRTLKVHRAILVLLECGAETELFFDLYELYSVAEFEADHFCFNNSRCINPDHLQWLTKEDNLRDRWVRHPDQDVGTSRFE